MGYWARHIQGRAFRMVFDHRSSVAGESFYLVLGECDGFVYVDRIVVVKR